MYALHVTHDYNYYYYYSGEKKRENDTIRDFSQRLLAHNTMSRLLQLFLYDTQYHNVRNININFFAQICADEYIVYVILDGIFFFFLPR